MHDDSCYSRRWELIWTRRNERTTWKESTLEVFYLTLLNTKKSVTIYNKSPSKSDLFSMSFVLSWDIHCLQLHNFSHFWDFATGKKPKCSSWGLNIRKSISKSHKSLLKRDLFSMSFVLSWDDQAFTFIP